MVLWITLGLFIVGLILAIVEEIKGSLTGWLVELGVWLFIGGGIVLGAMVLLLASTYLGLDADVSAYQNRYEMLVWQAESNVYSDDSTESLSKYNLIQDISKWNDEISRKKALQHNYWVGPFYPDIYDQFKIIDPYTISIQ